MKIKMLTTAAGPDGVWPAGSVQDVSAKVAKAMVDGGFAKKVVPPAKTKAAAAKAPGDAGGDDDKKPEGAGGDGDGS